MVDIRAKLNKQLDRAAVIAAKTQAQREAANAAQDKRIKQAERLLSKWEFDPANPNLCLYQQKVLGLLH